MIGAFQTKSLIIKLFKVQSYRNGQTGDEIDKFDPAIAADRNYP